MWQRLYISLVFVALSVMSFAQHTNTDLDAFHREPIFLNTTKQDSSDVKQKQQTDDTKNIEDKNKVVRKKEEDNSDKKILKPKQ
jgi:hypothetical protein